jgi:hypothetical protein
MTDDSLVTRGSGSSRTRRVVVHVDHGWRHLGRYFFCLIVSTSEVDSTPMSNESSWRTSSVSPLAMASSRSPRTPTTISKNSGVGCSSALSRPHLWTSDCGGSARGLRRLPQVRTCCHCHASRRLGRLECSYRIERSTQRRQPRRCEPGHQRQRVLRLHRDTAEDSMEVVAKKIAELVTVEDMVSVD